MNFLVEFSRKKLFIILGLLMFFLFILLALFSFLVSKKKQTISTPEDSKNPPIIYSPKPVSSISQSTLPKTILQKGDTAEKVIDWLKTMKNPSDGQYYYALLCDSNNVCLRSPTDKQVSITVLWSRYKHYKKSAGKAELTQIKQDVLNYSKRSEIEDYWLRVYQLDFWHCKLLYQMFQDDIFNAEYKNYLKNICQNSNYFLSRTELANIANSNQQDKIFPKDKLRFSRYNAIISDFISMYRWFGDDQLLKLAKTYFINSKNFYINNNLLPSESSYLTIASLDLYLVTKDKTYLDFANNLYNRFTDSDRRSFDVNQLTELCLSSQYYYDNISKNQKYLIIKDDSISKLINNGFDNQRGAFHSFTEKGRSYETRNNALIVDCLIN